MDVGTVGNADFWTAVFVDDDGEPVNPDGDVTWMIRDMRRRVIETVVQQATDRVSKGTYRLSYTPTKAEPYTVKVSAEVGGEEQSPDAVERSVNA
jgi:hypothetical protein